MKARENPFRSECVEALPYRATGFHWKTLEDRLAAAGGRGAIVGPQGHGKTTLLLEWKERCEPTHSLGIKLAEGQLSLTREQKHEVKTRNCIFLDGAEQLAWWGWRNFLWCSRNARRIVITTHRPGLLPTLFVCRTDPHLLNELVAELSGELMASPTLWASHHGNLRLAFRELYDTCSDSQYKTRCPIRN